MTSKQTSTLLRHIHKMAGTQAVSRLTDGQLLHRYVLHHEEDAFAALVQRHGRLVWGVCQHLLHREHDAEDAFQATFLVLARRAAAIRKGESVSSWLYGVAYRIARKARTMTAKRKERERQAGAKAPGPAGSELAWRELQALLDEEVQRLPEKYRAAFVLCCLEGRTRKDVAADLGLKEGTLSSRIALARRLLQTRLARRGVALSGALTAGELWGQTAAAAVPAALGNAIVKAVAGPASALKTMSASAIALAEGAMKTGAARLAAVLVPLALGLLTIGAGAMTYRSLAKQPLEPRQKEKPQPATRDGDQLRVHSDLQGDPLPAEARARLGTVRLRHGGYIGFLAFTPDGKHLVSQGQDGIRVWDTGTGKEERHLLVKSNGWMNAGEAALSPDGKVVITLEGRGTNSLICLRSRADLKLLRMFAVDRGLHSFCPSPNGKVCALLSRDTSTVEIWDVAVGRQLRSWRGHKGQTWIHTFSADGKTLITGGADKMLRFWDVATGNKKRGISCANMVGMVALSGDDKLLALVNMEEVKRVGEGTRVSVRDVASGKEVRQLVMPATKDLMGGPVGPIGFLTFAPDTKTIVTREANGMVRFWASSTGKELRHFAFGFNGAATLAFAPDGKTLAVAGATAIRLIDVATGKDLLPRTGHLLGVHATDLTPDGGTVATAAGVGAIRLPDGETVATAAGLGTIRLWDPATGRERARLNVRDSSVWANRLQIVGDGRRLLAAYTDKTVRVWDLATGKEQRRFDTSKWGSGWLAVSGDGKTLALAQNDKTVALVDVVRGKEIRKLGGLDRWGQGAAFTRDGRTLALWWGDLTVQVWDLAAGKKLRQFPLAEDDKKNISYIAAMSPDGRLIAYGSQLRYLVLHDLVTGKVVRRLENLPDSVSVIAFTPDSKTLAWGGWRQPTIHLVEVATGQERQQLIGHKGRVQSLTFSADSKTLLSGNDDTTALVWDMTGKFGAKDKWRGPLSAEDLTASWNDLGGTNAARAYRTMRKLAVSPASAIPFLGRQLQAVVAPADAKRLARLIADLDSAKFAVRQKAAKELEKLGEAAVGACRKALESEPPVEVRLRLESLLKKQNTSLQRLQTMRALEVLELAGTPQARHVLAALAKGAAAAWLTRDAKAALERLDRRK